MWMIGTLRALVFLNADFKGSSPAIGLSNECSVVIIRSDVLAILSTIES